MSKRTTVVHRHPVLVISTGPEESKYFVWNGEGASAHRILDRIAELRDSFEKNRDPGTYIQSDEVTRMMRDSVQLWYILRSVAIDKADFDDDFAQDLRRDMADGVKMTRDLIGEWKTVTQSEARGNVYKVLFTSECC